MKEQNSDAPWAFALVAIIFIICAAATVPDVIVRVSSASCEVEK